MARRAGPLEENWSCPVLNLQTTPYSLPSYVLASGNCLILSLACIPEPASLLQNKLVLLSFQFSRLVQLMLLGIVGFYSSIIVLLPMFSIYSSENYKQMLTLFVLGGTGCLKNTLWTSFSNKRISDSAHTQGSNGWLSGSPFLRLLLHRRWISLYLTNLS